MATKKLTNTGFGIHLDQLCAAAIRLGQMEQSTRLSISAGENWQNKKCPWFNHPPLVLILTKIKLYLIYDSN